VRSTAATRLAATTAADRPPGTIGHELAAIRHGDTWRRRGIRIISLIIAVLALLPVAYVFNGFRAATGTAIHINAVQRVGAEYLRPLTTLLAALVDAQDAAVRGEPLPTDAVRDAIQQVGRIDHESGDPLGVRQRWSQLRGQIEYALDGAVSGPAAVDTYAEAIGLTQALFSRISDTSLIASSPVADTRYLIDTAFVRVPEVIANSGEVAGLAQSAASAGSRIAIVLDRIFRAAQAIRIGPHSGADQTVAGAATMGLLAPLDEFTAAADGLAQTASIPGFAARQALADLDRALHRVRQAALGLDAAVLDALNAMLDRRLLELDAQHRNIVIAGVLISSAVVALLWWLWLRSDGPNRRHANRPGRPAHTGFPDGQKQREPEHAGPGLASVGRSAQVLRPREVR
jgi:hypothetical protein